MAGFGTVSLTQTAVGALLDQRAVVLYKQPKEMVEDDSLWGTISGELWGKAAGYEELFSGLLGGLGALSTVANTVGLNPYGITYIDAKVNIESDLCDHPVEDGTVVTDASIIQPVSAEVTVAMPTLFAERIYNQIYDCYKNKDPKILLQTKYGLYKNMVLQNIEYELEPETVDRSKFILSLREVQEVKSYNEYNSMGDSDTMGDASDSSTVDTGSQISL